MTDQTFHGIPVVTDSAVPEGTVVLIATPSEDDAEAQAAERVREHAEAAIVRHQAHAQAARAWARRHPEGGIA